MYRSPLHSPVVLAALATIAVATLTPGEGRGGWAPALPDSADFLVNIALFVPLGMAIRGAGVRSAGHPSLRWGQARRPLRHATLAALALSTAIELLQLVAIPGRDTSPWDILANTAGAALGAGLPATILTVPLIPAWLVSGWLLTPVPPSPPVWWGQWAHQFGSQAPFSGTIRTVTFNRTEAPGRRLGDSVTAQMKARYDNPPVQLTVTLFPPRSPSLDRNQVAGIASGDGGEVIGLWQLGWDLELTWHARGTRRGLRQPAIRAPGFLNSLPDTLHTIQAHVGAGHAVLEMTPAQRVRLRLGPWEGWRHFWPLDPPGPGWAWVMSVLWTAVCLGVPLMLWVPSLLGARRKPD